MRALEYVSLVSELNYMTQIVIMLYEDPTKETTSDQRFHVELHFSPGVNCCVQKDLPPGPGFRPHSRNNEQVNTGLAVGVGLGLTVLSGDWFRYSNIGLTCCLQSDNFCVALEWEPAELI